MAPGRQGQTPPSWVWSGPLVVEDLVQGMEDLYQVGLVGHHLVDVLVSRGDLIYESLGPARKPDLAGHLGSQVGTGEQPLGLGAAVPAARAVRARHPAVRVALAGHDVAGRPHRARDDAEVTLVRLDGTLAGHPQL